MTLVQAKRRRGQLPAEVTGFVGREDELAMLTELLHGTAPPAAGPGRGGQHRPRLVTVTGPGGVGKTRLALRAADHARRWYPGGVHFAELDAVSTPELLPAALAAGLGLSEHDLSEHGLTGDGFRELGQARDGDLAAVLAHLRDRRLLLILDTCEHLIEASARLTASVLRYAGGVTVLSTSRQPLDVPGEHLLPLRPLPVPGPGARDCAGSAVELFAQRAASVVPGFTVTDELLPDVIALCQRLDGIPLAIELAALRLRALPLAEMAQLAGRHDGQSRVLTGTRRTAVPRHQSLPRSTDWSLALCTPAERMTWARLSVFAGSFDLATAEAVCSDSGLPPGQVTQAVIGLTDKSVLLREPAPQDGTGPGPAREAASRYRLPYALREAGAGLLADTAYAGAGDAGAIAGTAAIARTDATGVIRARYVGHWTRVAERFASHVIDDQLSQYQMMRREHANLRAALDLALALPGTDPSAGRLGCALFMYWVLSGDLRQGRDLLDRVVGRYRQPSPQRARALAARAFLAAMAGDLGAGRADAEASIALATEVDDLVARARGYVALHRVESWTGEMAMAAATASLAVPALEEARDILGLAQIDIQSGLAHLATAPAACADICARGLRRLPPGELWATSYLLGLTVLAQFRTGDYAGAAESARKTLAMKHQLGDPVGVAYGLGVLGFLAGALGRHERAAVLLGAATPLWEHVGYRYTGNPWLEELHRKTIRAALDNLGEARYARLRDAGVARPLDEAIALALESAGPPGPPSASAAAPGTSAPPAGTSAAVTGAAGTRPAVTGPAVTGPAGTSPAGTSPAASRPASPSVTGPLTCREVEIAALVANGLSNKEIAQHMMISKRTVDAHVDHIFAKLGISSRVQLTLWLRDRIPRARPGQDQGQRAP